VRLHPAWSLTLVLVFVIAIVVPGAAMLLGLDAAAAMSREDRTLARWPAVRAEWQALQSLPGAASAYFGDHFAFRERLVRWQAALRLWGLQTSPSSDVIAGKDGWLFYAADGGVEDLTSADPFTRDELERWRLMLEHTDHWLRARGSVYLPVIAPDKHAIYPEYLPPSIHAVGPSRTDQLLRYLKDHSTVRVLDLRPALLRAKRAERVYHMTDTHWNDRGAFAAYRAIADALGPTVVDAPPGRDAFLARAVSTRGRDLAAVLGLAGAIGEVDLTLVPRTPRRARVVEPEHPNRYGEDARIVTVRDDATLPRAVVFRDSFGSALVPFLSEHFARTVFLWQANLDPEVVEAERPRVVIQEWAGRRLTTLAPYDALNVYSSTATHGDY
jgi:hypothetical protein